MPPINKTKNSFRKVPVNAILMLRRIKVIRIKRSDPICTDYLSHVGVLSQLYIFHVPPT